MLELLPAENFDPITSPLGTGDRDSDTPTIQSDTSSSKKNQSMIDMSSFSSQEQSTPNKREFTRLLGNTGREDTAGRLPKGAVQSKRYFLGVALLFLVALLWVSSSELIQAIFLDMEFNKPFLLTFFSTGLFSIYLCTWALTPQFWRCIAACRNQEQPLRVPKSAFKIRQVLKVSLQLCPVWFCMNYFFNVGLTLTSVASTTVLSSTSGLYVMLLSCLFLSKPINRFNCAGVLVTIVGAALVSQKDSSSQQSGNNQFYGDVSSAFSAFCYAVYTVMLSKLVTALTQASSSYEGGAEYRDYPLPSSSSPSSSMSSSSESDEFPMQLMFGLLGCVNLVCLWPGFLILHYTGLETFAPPPARVFLFLFVNGLFGSVLADFLWAKAVLLTSPLVATLGLSLTIPIAMVADLLLKGRTFSLIYTFGSLLIVCGFVAVNWEHRAEQQQQGGPYNQFQEAGDEDNEEGDDDSDGAGVAGAGTDASSAEQAALQHGFDSLIDPSPPSSAAASSALRTKPGVCASLAVSPLRSSHNVHR